MWSLLIITLYLFLLNKNKMICWFEFLNAYKYLAVLILLLTENGAHIQLTL